MYIFFAGRHWVRIMQSWTAPLWCVLVVISLTEGQDEHPNDSLKTAIEAVSRRQRDLAGPRPNYYASGGLSHYRYADRDTEPVDELAFLTAPRDFTGKMVWGCHGMHESSDHCIQSLESVAACDRLKTQFNALPKTSFTKGRKMCVPI